MQTGSAAIACLDNRSAEAWRKALRGAGFEPVGTAATASDILPMLLDCRPGVLLADAILPGGDGVYVARAVAEASLNLYPHVLLVPTAGMVLPCAETLDGLGAVLPEGMPTPRAIADAVEALGAKAHRLPPFRQEKLKALLDRLGVPDHPGREMLQNASALVWRDRGRLRNLRDRVYPDSAKPLGRTGAQAERAIRHVIEAAWRTGEIDEQQRIFGDTIDARRGRPTCGEMIAQLADILRWEG